MLIWNGWGFLVAVIGFGCLLVAEISVEAAMRDDQYYQNNGWPKMAAFVAAAIIVWPLGLYLNKRRPERELVDPQTGEIVILRSGGHSLFFIPMQFWAPVFLVLALIFLFVR